MVERDKLRRLENLLKRGFTTEEIAKQISVSDEELKKMTDGLEGRLVVLQHQIKSLNKKPDEIDIKLGKFSLSLKGGIVTFKAIKPSDNGLINESLKKILRKLGFEQVTKNLTWNRNVEIEGKPCFIEIQSTLEMNL